jgi:hypothetical protein
MEPSHSVPPQVHATAGTRQREGTSSSGPGLTLLNRSKSAAALPVASGVSVTTGGMLTSGLSVGKSQETETKTTPIRGKVSIRITNISGKLYLMSPGYVSFVCLPNQRKMQTFLRHLRLTIHHPCWQLPKRCAG